jgi:thymidylate kinase
MRESRLIMVEGVPGAGKSSTAQWLTHRLSQQAIAARWWYEEEVGHPIYLFRDAASLAGVQADLAVGRFDQLVEAALAQWQTFVDDWLQQTTCAVVDGCLFGYLAWSLFYWARPAEQIADYLARVAAIVQPLRPVVVHCRPYHLARTLTDLSDKRGTPT